MRILTFDVKSDRKQWWLNLQQAKYRFLEAGPKMLIGCISNITLRVGISIYKQAGQETEGLSHFHAPNSTGVGKVHVPL